MIAWLGVCFDCALLTGWVGCLTMSFGVLRVICSLWAVVLVFVLFCRFGFGWVIRFVFD